MGKEVQPIKPQASTKRQQFDKAFKLNAVSLLTHIKAVHQQFRQAYGAVKTWKHLNRIGIVCGKHRVAALE
jgi:hypothetical protein